MEELTSRLIDDANAVSGDIVLRAAKRGSNANELIGVVLSKFLVDAELNPEAPRAWLFLDDYAAWLGQDEKRIADMLCLAPGMDDNGNSVLEIIVTEAKYISAANAKAKAADSERQLRDTLIRLEEALLAEEAPADSHIWRARLSDMLLDGLRDPSGAMATLGADWRVALRDASCRIALRGYSHVFAHGAPGVGDHVSDERIGVRPTKTGFQERYSPETLRHILRCYAKRQSPNQVRRDAIGDWQADLTATTSAAPPTTPFPSQETTSSEHEPLAGDALTAPQSSNSELVAQVRPAVEFEASDKPFLVDDRQAREPSGASRKRRSLARGSNGALPQRLAALRHVRAS